MMRLVKMGASLTPRLLRWKNHKSYTQSRLKPDRKLHCKFATFCGKVHTRHCKRHFYQGADARVVLRRPHTNTHTHTHTNVLTIWHDAHQHGLVFLFPQPQCVFVGPPSPPRRCSTERWIRWRISGGWERNHDRSAGLVNLPLPLAPRSPPPSCSTGRWNRWSNGRKRARHERQRRQTWRREK